MKEHSISTLAKAALVVATIIWGGSFVVLKNAVTTMPPYFVLGVRSLMATVILSAVFWKRFKKMNHSYLWEGGIMGVLLFVAFAFQTNGLMSTTPGKNAFLTSVYCVLVPFFYWMFTRIRPDRYNVFAALLCIIGIGFVSLRGEAVAAGGPLVAPGDVLTLISGIFYALHIVSVAKFASGKDIILLTIVQFIVYSILSWGMFFLLEKAPESISLTEGLSLLYLGVFATALALLLQNVGQKYTPASQAAVILSLEGGLGVAFSIVFYHEQMTARLLIGFILIFASVLISETKLNVHPIAYFQNVYAKIIDKKTSQK